MAIVLSQKTINTWASPNLDGVVWRFRNPSPAHATELQAIRVSSVSDDDMRKLSLREISEVELQQRMNIRAAMNSKWQMQRMMFAACVVGVDGINIDEAGTALDLSTHREHTVIGGTTSTKLTEAIMADLEAGEVALDIAALGQHLVGLCGLKATEKKP